MPMCETLSLKTVKIRKPRRCEWCGEWLAVGETASVWAGTVEGEFQNNSLHPECQEAGLASMEPGDACFTYEPYSFQRGIPLER